MFSSFEIEEKKLIFENKKWFCPNSIQILKDKIFYRSHFKQVSVRDIPKGKLSYSLLGHDYTIFQILILQMKVHSDFNILVSYDMDGILKFWSNSNKKCLRTFYIFTSFSFAVFRSNIIVFAKSLGLGIFNFKGEQVKEIKDDPYEIEKCYSMVIKKNLLIYGDNDYIIIRNLDKKFERLSRLSKVRGYFDDLTSFYNLSYGRLELIMADLQDSVVIFEMESFKEVNYCIDKSLKCETNVVHWNDILIFGFGYEVIFCKIKRREFFHLLK